MTVTLGWWLIPLIATVILFSLAEIDCRKNILRNGMWLERVVSYSIALNISLASWLIWSLFA